MEESMGFSGNGIERDEIFSKVVRAGKRTYFFDVKATRKDEYYLTITESKKRFNKNGGFFYEKHKLFLYKEDFDKFQDGLEDALSFINSSNDLGLTEQESIEEVDDAISKDYSNVEFEHLEDSLTERKIKEDE